MTPATEPQTRAVLDVIRERFRQINEEGFKADGDDKYRVSQLAMAAVNYAAAAVVTIRLGGKSYDSTPPFVQWIGIDWPWEPSWWKPGAPRRMLVKAAALIIAEIERLDRAEEGRGSHG